MLNSKPYTQLLVSLRRLVASTPAFHFSKGVTSKVSSDANRPRPKTSVERIARKTEQIVNKTTTSAPRIRIPAKQTLDTRDTTAQERVEKRKLADMVEPKEAPQEMKSGKSRGRKEVDPQTLYYNIRKKNYENPIRQKKYFKEETEKNFLEQSEIQQKIYKCQTVEQVLRLYHGYKFTFSARNFVTTINKLAKFLPIEHKQHRKVNAKLKIKKAFPYKANEKRIHSLLFALDEVRKSLNSAEKIAIVWALTRMRYNEIDVYVKLVDELFETLPELKSDHLCLLSWCLSQIGSRNPKFYGMISNELEKRLNNMKENDRFMVQEAYIAQGNLPQRKKGDISRQPEQVVEAVEEQNEENSDEEWVEMEEFGEVEEEIEPEPEVPVTSPQDTTVDQMPTAHGVSLLLWSFCRQNIQDDNLFSMLEHLFVNDIQNFSIQQIGNVLHGYIRIGRGFENQQLEVIQNRLKVADISQEKTLTLKGIITTLNKFDVNDQQLYKKYIAQLLQINKKSMSPRFTCETLRVIVDKKVWDKSFLGPIDAFVLNNIRFFNMEDCMSSFESYIRLYNTRVNIPEHLEGISIKATLDVIVTRLGAYNADLSNKHKKILKKILGETKYNHKELEELL